MTLQLPDFSSSSVLVIGDLMLDRYWHGPTHRISPEAPVPVVRVSESDDRLGGAANVALNLATLGSSTLLLGTVGEDEAGDKLSQMAEQAGIRCLLTADASHPTITKLRIISRQQQLIRMDFEQPLHHYDKAPLLKHFEQELANHSLVLLSDYGKGTLSEAPHLIQLAQQAGVRVLVDPKGSDFSRYRGAWLVTPNLAEFEAVAGVCDTDDVLQSKAAEMCRQYDWHALLVTLGERGMLLVEQGCDPLLIAAEARDVYDVTGAGDTVIATLAASLAAGCNAATGARIANTAASIVVGKLGTATASPAEIQNRLQHRQLPDSGCLDEAALVQAVQAARQRGERIVMTNGCFDLLHVGHLRYLQQAAALGDRLIVAVNSDESVAGIKGPQRPLNRLRDRMEMLAGMECVDWVVDFSEATPARLIASVLPDILVKGGDYRAEDIAGYGEVTAAGGEVRILGFESGYSTTALIEKIRAN